MNLLQPYLVVEMASSDAPQAHQLAIAVAGRIAADMGARVVKVVPRSGNPIASIPVLPYEQVDEAAALAAVLDASKTILALDLDDTADLAAWNRLLARADGLLSDDYGSRPSEPGRRVDIAVRVLPDNVPSTLDPSELSILALSGMLDVIGDPDRSPLALGGHQVAYAGGYTAFTALMGGLASQRPRRMTVDLLDVMMWANWKGVATPKFRPGAELHREGTQAEWQVFPCLDGYTALVFSEKDWRPLAEIIGDPLLLESDLFSLLGREKRRNDYLPIIRKWFSERTREDIYRRMQARGVPIGPIFGLDELASERQFASRDALARVKGKNGDEVVMPKLPLRWNGVAFEPVPTVYANNLEEALA